MLRCRGLPSSQRHRALAAIAAAIALTGKLLGQLAIILSRHRSLVPPIYRTCPGYSTQIGPVVHPRAERRYARMYSRWRGTKGYVERRAWTRRRQRIRLRDNDFCCSSAVSAGEEFAVIGTESIGNLPL